MTTLRQQYESLPVNILKKTLASGNISKEDAELCRQVIEEKTGEKINMSEYQQAQNRENETNNSVGGRTMSNSQDVKIVDVNMPFMSMVVFMIKWSVAAIPAMLVLLLAGGIGIAMFGGIFGNML